MSKPSKYYSFARAKTCIAKFGFKTLVEYRQFVTEHNINFLPLHPEKTYKNHAPYEVLGLDAETYKKNIAEYRASQCGRMRSFLTPESHIKRSLSRRASFVAKNTVASTPKPQAPKPQAPKVEQVVVNTIVGLDPDKVIKFLISEDVDPTTIAKMVADMDIHSSTLMNELCKYMQERSKRHQATWRPTGYQTAEAEFAKVG
jgi:hypothetical protein